MTIEELFTWRSELERKLRKQRERLEQQHREVQRTEYQIAVLSKEMTAKRIGAEAVK